MVVCFEEEVFTFQPVLKHILSEIYRVYAALLQLREHIVRVLVGVIVDVDGQLRAAGGVFYGRGNVKQGYFALI